MPDGKTFSLLLAIADEAPWCGTRWPGWHPHPPKLTDRLAVEAPDLVRFTAMHVAIRLAQAGTALGGAEGSRAGQIASEYFDGFCGTVPISVLIAWLLHHPPPPPPPYLQDVLTGMEAVVISRAMPEGAVRSALHEAGMRQTAEALRGAVPQQR